MRYLPRRAVMAFLAASVLILAAGVFGGLSVVATVFSVVIVASLSFSTFVFIEARRDFLATRDDYEDLEAAGVRGSVLTGAQETLLAAWTFCASERVRLLKQIGLLSVSVLAPFVPPPKQERVWFVVYSRTLFMFIALGLALNSYIAYFVRHKLEDLRRQREAQQQEESLGGADT